MALDKFYNIYGLDTSAFYFDDEMALNRKLDKAKRIKSKCKKRQELLLNSCGDVRRKELISKQKRTLKRVNRIIRETKAELKDLLADRVGLERTARPEAFVPTNIISTFDSDLARCFELKSDAINEEIIVVQIYFFDVAHGLALNGFTHNGNRYCYFSSSAGQIRTKKMVFVREDILNRVWNRLTCGLTVERINELGGVNPNKYLAYLALCNSATDKWEKFNIDKVIVVDDMENIVHGVVDFMDDKDYSISRQEMDLPFTQTDGVGMARRDVIKSNRMFRAPWMKGLLARFAFDELIREKGWSPIVEDIYGVKHDVLAEDIEIILTKSQFKMWSYFDSWEQYKENFKKYGCSAGYCKAEEDWMPNAKTNYQMLQTLTDITSRELVTLASKTVNKISNIASDKETMLSMFGVTPHSTNLNAFQEALTLYPELLADPYTKEQLSSAKKAMEYSAWCGKLDILGKYTFIIPDMYAVCEHMFGGIANPDGLLADGEVYCGLFKRTEKLDCVRSPHLYKEHAVRKNMAAERSERDRWFDTKALYISTHDLISRILQCDFDGDTSLVIADDTFVRIAERNMKGVVPLFYNMAKAPKSIITKQVLFDGLVKAFTGGNIGLYSNSISKIWNSGNITEDAIKSVKWLCMDNNFVIDYAKTLYKPQAPENVKAVIEGFTNAKLPHFFVYAKDKPEESVEPRNNSCVNRLRSLIPRKNLRLRFPMMDDFNYKVLMNNPNIEIDKEVIHNYEALVVYASGVLTNADDEVAVWFYYYSKIKSEMFSMGYSESDIVDMLVKYYFHLRKSKRKVTLWNTFGDIIVDNIKRNLDTKFTTCKHCGRRYMVKNDENGLCSECRKTPPEMKVGYRIMVCQDCGRDIGINLTNTRTVRCPECQAKHRRKKVAINVRRHRSCNH